MGAATSLSRTRYSEQFAAHLHTRSGYSYGQGVAYPDELAEAAAGMGYHYLALTDRDGMYGVPRFMAACEEHGISPIVGAEITVEACGVRGHVVLLCESAAGYATLSDLISRYRGQRMGRAGEDHRGHPSASSAAERRFPVCPVDLLLERASQTPQGDGLVCLTGTIPYGLVPGLVERGKWSEAERLLGELTEVFGKYNLCVELTDDRTRWSRKRLRRVAGLAEQCGLPTVATNEVTYVDPEDHRLSEAMWAAYNTTSLPGPGHRPTDQLYLKPAPKMERLFEDYPEAVSNTARIAERCSGTLGRTIGEFADRVSGGTFAPAYRVRGSGGTGGAESRRKELLDLVLAGARKRYRGREDVSYREVLARLRRELSCIGSLGYSSYFLVAAEAREIAVQKGTPVTGRGSAANSLVCHVLGLTQPDPLASSGRPLLFERFMHEGRKDAPDVDLDFDSDLRDEVRGSLIARYEKHAGAGVAATAQTYSLRGGIRAASRALGYTPAQIDALARGVPARIRDRDTIVNDKVSSVWEYAFEEPSMRGSLLQGEESRDRYALLLDLSERLAGRLQGAGTHLGGLVVGTDYRHLTQIVPMEPTGKPGLSRIQWDAEDLDRLRLPKLDLLGLKMHSALRKAGELVSVRVGEPVDPLSPPPNDRATYRLIASGDTAGQFQTESPGQRELSRRLRPKRLEHLQAQISLFRPGPLRGSLVEPYVARKNGLEAYSAPLPELEEILRPTYGVLVYQESVIEIAGAIAGYTPAEADGLRRAMTKDRGPGAMEGIREDFLERTISRGVPEDKTREVFELLSGFASYGFSAAHAASFAEISYASAYMMAHYPAEFIGGGLLNSQPMGYYSPRVLVEEARRKGITILPPDIHLSEEGFTVEHGGTAIRPGLSYCRGLSKRAIEEILAGRTEEPFSSPADLYQRTSVGRDALTNLIEGGFLDRFAPGSASTGLSPGAARRELLDRSGSLPVKKRNAKSQSALPHPAGYWESANENSGAVLSMPFPPAEAERRQRRVLGLDVSGHPLTPYREALEKIGVTPAGELRELQSGTRARAAGIMESFQRPPAKPGNRPVNFLLVEDETGLLQCTMFSRVFRSQGHVIYEAGAFLLEGTVEHDERRGFSFVIERIADLAKVLAGRASNVVDARTGKEGSSSEHVSEHYSQSRASTA